MPSTIHRLINGDARDLTFIDDESVHLVVTSPPYWNLKRYNEHPDQLGHVQDYEAFLNELEKVWRHVFRILVLGGRLVCVVGDVCVARRDFGRHLVFPLHADICVICRRLGFDNLNPIIWHKISNASYEVTNGSKFLGKPYEPNAIIKNDMEFILMQRKPGGYRQPTDAQRNASRISKEEFNRWFQQIWNLTDASTRHHPAPSWKNLRFTKFARQKRDWNRPERIKKGRESRLALSPPGGYDNILHSTKGQYT
jgi:site-specific DNA-methyltransferase (adenine-specific)